MLEQVLQQNASKAEAKSNQSQRQTVASRLSVSGMHGETSSIASSYVSARAATEPSDAHQPHATAIGRALHTGNDRLGQARQHLQHRRQLACILQIAGFILCGSGFLLACQGQCILHVAGDAVFLGKVLQAHLLRRVPRSLYAAGISDDLLTATLLTARCPVVFAPAMHTEMWLHPATRANVATLRERGVVVLDPASGRLTGADSGSGRLPEPDDIAAAEVLANAAYEIQANRLNKRDSFDADLYKKLLREALGEHKVGDETYGGIATYRNGWWGNHNVVVPTWVKQDGFSTLMKSLKPEDLTYGMREDGGGKIMSPVDYKGRPIELEALRRAKLLSVGDGQYLMYYGDLNSDPQWVRAGTENGERYVLDLARMRPALARRRPDLVLGAK